MSDLDLFEQVALDEMTCSACGVRFGIARPLHALRKSDYNGFWCPNGHRLAYARPPKTRDEQIEALMTQLAEARDELAASRAEVDQLKAARRPLLWVGRRR